MTRRALAIALLLAAFVVGWFAPAAAGKPGVSTLTIPDGVFGGSVTGTYTGDRKAYSSTGGVWIKCYTPDLTGTLVLEYGVSINGDDGTVVISPLAGWDGSWLSGPGDCTADAGYYTFPHENKYHPGNREWISLATDTFHVDG